MNGRLSLALNVLSVVFLLAFVAGGFLLFSRMQDAQHDLDKRNVALGSRVEELGEKADATERKLDKAKQELSKFETELYDRPFVLYRMKLENPPKLNRKGPQPINFNQAIYDSHGAVMDESSWRFHAPKDGIYTVTAYVAFHEPAKSLQMALERKTEYVDKINCYFVVTGQYLGGGVMVGGSAPIALKRGNSCRLIVNPDADTDLVFATAGNTWIWIRYERPIPPNWHDE